MSTPENPPAQDAHDHGNGHGHGHGHGHGRELSDAEIARATAQPPRWQLWDSWARLTRFKMRVLHPPTVLVASRQRGARYETQPAARDIAGLRYSRWQGAHDTDPVVHKIEPSIDASSEPSPQPANPGATIYLHGGAYVLPLQGEKHLAIAARMVRFSGRAVFAVQYPLIPHASAAESVAAVLSVYRQLIGEFGAKNITVMGDSAGGGLALSLLHAAREAGLPQPKQAVLLWPWLDVAMANPRIEAIAAVDPILHVPHLQELGQLWAGELPAEHPLVSPVHVNVVGLCAIRIVIGTHDVLYPDCIRLRENALLDGTRIQWHEQPGRRHGWMTSSGSKAAREQFAEIMGEVYPTGPGAASA